MTDMQRSSGGSYASRASFKMAPIIEPDEWHTSGVGGASATKPRSFKAGLAGCDVNMPATSWTTLWTLVASLRCP